MSDFFGKLKSGAEKLAFEADKMNRLSRAKGDIEKVKNQIQTQYAKLGELYNTQHETTGVSGSESDAIYQEIQGSADHLISLANDLQRIIDELNALQGTQPAAHPASPSGKAVPATSSAHSATATKLCPNCGTLLPVETKFCPNCGSKV